MYPHRVKSKDLTSVYFYPCDWTLIYLFMSFLNHPLLRLKHTSLDTRGMNHHLAAFDQ